jgi:hypothetical protein
MIRAEFMIDGRRTGVIQVHRCGEGPSHDLHEYAWLVENGGHSRRGFVLHRAADGQLALVHAALGHYLAGTGRWSWRAAGPPKFTHPEAEDAREDV